MGEKLTEVEVARLVGHASPFVMREFLRSGASVGELRRAIVIAGSARMSDRKLPVRVRRLVDLVVAVGDEPPTGCAA